MEKYCHYCLEAYSHNVPTTFNRAVLSIAFWSLSVVTDHFIQGRWWEIYNRTKLFCQYSESEVRPALDWMTIIDHMMDRCVTAWQLGQCGQRVWHTEGIIQGGLVVFRGPSVGLKHSLVLLVLWREMLGYPSFTFFHPPFSSSPCWPLNTPQMWGLDLLMLLSSLLLCKKRPEERQISLILATHGAAC